MKNLYANSVRLLSILVAAIPLSIALPPAAFAGTPHPHPRHTPQQSQQILRGSLLYVSGTICKGTDGEVILRDASATGLFWLDDQRLASRYFGKQVSVTGVLDAANNLIRILTIRLAD